MYPVDSFKVSIAEHLGIYPVDGVTVSSAEHLVMYPIDSAKVSSVEYLVCTQWNVLKLVLQNILLYT